MNQLRFAAFLFSFATLLWLSALGQTSQGPTTPTTPPAGVTIQSLPALNTAPDASVPSQQRPDDGAWRRPFVVPIEPKKSQTPTLLFPIQGSPKFRLRAYGNRSPNPNLDRGIFMPHPSAGNGCGSIVSYNFSPGDNPQLESITTCTPSDAVATRRAEGEGKKPSTPQIQKTVLRQPQ